METFLPATRSTFAMYLCLLLLWQQFCLVFLGVRCCGMFHTAKHAERVMVEVRSFLRAYLSELCLRQHPLWALRVP